MKVSVSRKKLFLLFGVIDVISIVLLGPQVVLIIRDGILSTLSHWAFWITIMRILLFFSLFISAFGLLMNRDYGVVCYFIQFVFRFPTLVFSLGFITYLNVWLMNDDVLRILLAFAVFAELLRLTYSILVYMKVRPRVLW